MRQKKLAERAARDGITIEEAERRAQAERHDRIMIRLRRRGWRP